MKDKRWGLATIVVLWTAGAIAAAMAVYACHEYATAATPEPPLDLLRRHAGHVLALSAVTYGVVCIGFGSVLLKPIREIAAHLYRIGSGRVRPLLLHSRVRELQAIADGVNLMVQRMELSMGFHAIDHVQEELETLRSLARALRRRSSGAAAKDADELLRCATSLQAAFVELVQFGCAECSSERSIPGTE